MNISKNWTGRTPRPTARPPSPNRTALAGKIAQLKERQGRYDELLGELKASDQNEISLTDADSRKLKGAHGHLLGYNVQVAVDAKHDLIVAEQVVQAANDRGQLSSLALAAKEALQVETLQALADKGYHEADQLEACEQAGVETFVPQPGSTSGRSPEGKEIFPKERFTYDTASDTYECPAGQTLKRATASTSQGQEPIVYYHRAACAACALKAQCTSGAYRKIARRTNEAVVERAASRAEAHPEKIAQRKEIVEHVFGNLRLWGHDTFLMRGLGKVRAEFTLSALVYNLRRVLNLVSLTELLRALGLEVKAAAPALA